MEQMDNIRRAYDGWSEEYDTDDNPVRDLNAQILRRRHPDLAEKAVLEIGCGTGLNTMWLAKHARRVTAADFATGMLEKAAERVTADNVRFVEMDATREWPFGGNTFDVIIITLVLEHIHDLAFIFRESHRVLKQGGILYIGELHPFRQRMGTQANYGDPETGEKILVEAFVHELSEFVNNGIDAGFRLQRMGEHKRPEDRVPLILTLTLAKP